MTDEADSPVVLAELYVALFRKYKISNCGHGKAILLFYRSCYRSLLKHQSWSTQQLEQVLLVYYQLLQTSPFSVILLQSQLPHKQLFVDSLFGVDCSPELTTAGLAFSPYSDELKRSSSPGHGHCQCLLQESSLSYGFLKFLKLSLTLKLVYRLAFRTPKFYIVPYDKINH